MKRVLFLALLSMAIVSCDDAMVNEPLENKAPIVSVFLEANSVDSFNRTSSKQILHWDGKDPDGLVVGFYYTFGNSADRDNWIFLNDTVPEGPELINAFIPSWRFTTDRADTPNTEFTIKVGSRTVIGSRQYNINPRHRLSALIIRNSTAQLSFRLSKEISADENC